MWKGLLPYFKPYRRTLLLVLIFNMVCVLIDILLPLFQRDAIDRFIEAGTLEGVWIFAGVYAAVIALQAISVIIFTRGAMRIEMHFGRDLKRACFVHLQTLSFSYYNVTPVGYILSRVMSDTNRIAAMVAWNFFDMLWALGYVLGVFVAMLLLNWKLALLIILVVPVIAALTAYFQNRILHWNRKVRKINSQITSAFNEGIMGAKTSKTLVIEEQNHEEFRRLTQEMRSPPYEPPGSAPCISRWCFSSAHWLRPSCWRGAASWCWITCCRWGPCPPLPPTPWGYSNRFSSWRGTSQN